MIVVWYEEWEMACCGSFFALESKVVWPVSKFHSFDSGYLPTDMEQQIGAVDYRYDMHASSSAGLYTLTGIIKNIKGVYFYFEPDPQKPNFYHRVSGFLTEMIDCDYWTEKKMAPKGKKGRVPQPSFDAYLIGIEDLEIRPIQDSDQHLWI